jgi:hypothetical protein
MTAERSSEDNDGHQVRATIGLAGAIHLPGVDVFIPRSMPRRKAAIAEAGSPSSMYQVP